ncbi:hypothetical protein AB1Y20_002128 [Prymnesium parvum]|uniref:Uncharacterized protein n=1 Tax=Prymnesium parvum TaxID=97485 RepID=A0AB34JAQ3_PRYPA
MVFPLREGCIFFAVHQVCSHSKVPESLLDVSPAKRGSDAASANRARPTVSPRPASPALRAGGALVDVDITRSGGTPLLANPFKLGPSGKDELLRQLAAVTYRDWLDLRTVAAQDMRSALPVAASMRLLTGA